MTVHSNEIESRLPGEGDVASQVVGRRRGQVGASRSEICPLHEESLTVDREHPFAHRHFTQAGPARAVVAQFSVDDHFEGHVGERLFAEAPRPPQLRIVDVDVPVDVVDTDRHRSDAFVDHSSVDESSQLDLTLVVAVETGVESKVGSCFVRVAAGDSPGVDTYWARGLQADPSPDSSGIERG